jgi:hypothetical protein
MKERGKRNESAGGKDAAMAHAVVQDIAASWHGYERFAERTIATAPTGLILHVAGPAEDGFRIIQIWDSETAWARFQTQRLISAIAELSGPSRPSPSSRHLEAGHLVLGATPGQRSPSGDAPSVTREEGDAGRPDRESRPQRIPGAYGHPLGQAKDGGST